MKLKIEYCANCDYIIIHTDVKITENYISSYDDNENVPEFLKEVRKIPGVIEGSCSNYQFSIKKAECFNFDLIIKKAILIFRRAYGIRKKFIRLPDKNYISPPHRYDDLC